MGDVSYFHGQLCLPFPPPTRCGWEWDGRGEGTPLCFLRLREVVQSGEEEGLENPESPFQYLKGAYKKKGEE